MSVDGAFRILPLFTLFLYTETQSPTSSGPFYDIIITYGYSHLNTGSSNSPDDNIKTSNDAMYEAPSTFQLGDLSSNDNPITSHDVFSEPSPSRHFDDVSIHQDPITSVDNIIGASPTGQSDGISSHDSPLTANDVIFYTSSTEQSDNVAAYNSPTSLQDISHETSSLGPSNEFSSHDDLTTANDVIFDTSPTGQFDELGFQDDPTTSDDVIFDAPSSTTFPDTQRPNTWTTGAGFEEQAATMGNLASITLDSKQAVVEELLNETRYTNRVRPGYDDEIPTVVEVNMYMNDISSVDEVNMELTMNVFLRQIWTDPRLADPRLGRGVSLNYNQFNRLWVPDLFVKNEKRGQFHIVTVPNRLLRLNKDGSILYSQRLSLTLGCTMRLKKYPLDNQTCQINLESYGYTTDDVQFEWRRKEPIQMRKGLALAEFQITETTNGNCTTEYITGTFTCIYAEFQLERQIEYYITQTYIPSVLIVILSWVSFWIDMNAVPARITLGLLTVLTMTTQTSGVSQRLPRVSYVKAIDVWMATCLCFVFGALVEYSIVNVLARRVLSFRLQEARSQRSQQARAGWAALPDPVISKNIPTTATASPKSPSLHQRVYQATAPITNGLRTESTGEITINIHRDTSFVSRSNSSSVDDLAKDLARRNQMANDVTGEGEAGVAVASLDVEDAIHECACFTSCNGYLWRTNRALWVDVFSRVFFPVAFVIFNIGYWIGYIWLVRVDVTDP